MTNELTFPNKMRVPSAFEVSHLLNKPAPTWEKRVENLDQQKPYRVLEYKPLRDAVVAELRKPGMGLQKLNDGLDGYNSGFSTDAMIRAMRECFEVFEQRTRLKVGQLIEAYTEPPVRFGFKVGGFDITGSMHAKVMHPRYGDCLAYFYASQWDDSEAKAFQELLIMIAEQAFEIDGDRVLWFDLRAGTCKPLRSRPSLRPEISRGVRHFYRTFRR